MTHRTFPFHRHFLLLVSLTLLATGCSLTGGGGQKPGASGSPSATAPQQPQSSASGAPGHTSSPSASAPSSSVTPPPATQTPPPSNDPTADAINRMMQNMTLAQKVGQMIMAGIDGTSIDKAARAMIAERHVGGIILYKDNFSDLGGSVRLINALKQANEGQTAPLFISVDQEGGKVSRLPKDFTAMPDARTVGQSSDAALAEQMGALLAAQLRVMGLNVDYAPVLDVNSNPNNPVIGKRAFGSRAELVSKMGLAAMKGLREGGVVSVVKHFPGHGDTSVDSHLDLPVVRKTAEQLAKLEWVPFRAAIDAKADAVMVAHILFPLVDADAPASMSKVIIGKQLRGTMGYDGVVITDDMTMGAITKNYGITEASLLSVEAGSDIVLVAHGYETAARVNDALLEAVQSGRIKASRIDESVRRILALKLKYHLTDAPVPVPAADDLPNAEVRSWLKKLDAAK